MVLGAVRCMNNANIEKKITKWQHCARYVYCLSEITTRTINLKNTVLVHADLQRIPQRSTVPSRYDVLAD